MLSEYKGKNPKLVTTTPGRACVNYPTRAAFKAQTQILINPSPGVLIAGDPTAQKHQRSPIPNRPHSVER